MDEHTEKSQLEKVAEVLLRDGVEFIVIGGQAESIHGSPRVTYDVDLCYRRTRENLEHLARALNELDVVLRDAPPDLPFRVDAAALGLGDNYTFETRYGPVDLLGHLEPLGTYEEIIQNVEHVRLGDIEIPVISLDDLIRVKEHTQRPKDVESLRHLLAIKQVRQQRRKE